MCDQRQAQRRLQRTVCRITFIKAANERSHQTKAQRINNVYVLCLFNSKSKMKRAKRRKNQFKRIAHATINDHSIQLFKDRCRFFFVVHKKCKSHVKTAKQNENFWISHWHSHLLIVHNNRRWIVQFNRRSSCKILSSNFRWNETFNRWTHSHQIDGQNSLNWMRKLEQLSKYWERKNVVTVEMELLLTHGLEVRMRHTDWPKTDWIEVCCSHDPFTTLTKPKCSRRVRFCCGATLFILCFAAAVNVLVGRWRVFVCRRYRNSLALRCVWLRWACVCVGFGLECVRLLMLLRDLRVLYRCAWHCVRLKFSCLCACVMHGASAFGEYG